MTQNKNQNILYTETQITCLKFFQHRDSNGQILESLT